MEYTWRWFGPDDPVTLADARQAGATGIVSALHHLPNGTLWSVEEITKRHQMITAAGLRWSVVESIPVPEAIKLAQPGWEALADIWAQSALNCAQCGITTICYNFMPVLDWTRTQLRHVLPDGAECLRFDQVDQAVFDLFILQRKGAVDSHSARIQELAADRFTRMDSTSIRALTDTILAGLPGSEESYSLDEFLAQVDNYSGLGEDGLRANLTQFLQRILPRLAAKGVKLAIHPDDPPRSLFGLPRVVSTASDLEAILKMYDDPANGLTFCSGSLGVRADNDLPVILRDCAHRVNFLHLRNTRRDESLPSENAIDGESFQEAAHLDGDSDMVAIVSIILDIEAGRATPLPFRPDHGHALQSDLHGDYRPGYTAVGRLRGMAEIRGVEAALKAVRMS